MFFKDEIGYGEMLPLCDYYNVILNKEHFLNCKKLETLKHDIGKLWKKLLMSAIPVATSNSNNMSLRL